MFSKTSWPLLREHTRNPRHLDLPIRTLGTERCCVAVTRADKRALRSFSEQLKAPSVVASRCWCTWKHVPLRMSCHHILGSLPWGKLHAVPHPSRGPSQSCSMLVFVMTYLSDFMTQRSSAPLPRHLVKASANMYVLGMQKILVLRTSADFAITATSN